MSDEREIERVRRAEASTGRESPAQIEAAAERLELLRYAHELLEEDSQEVVEASMRMLGLEQDGAAWKKALQVWRSRKRGRR